ncbi:MAG: DUF7670 domain-containing protein [Bryobacteraceae bacterium]
MMAWTRKDWIVWTPRILSLFLIGFISLFALDVFTEARPWMEAAVAILVHLIPGLLLLGVLVLAWRRPWIGAAGYAAMALAYAVFARRHPGWVAVISGPLLVTACIFWLSWRLQKSP